MKFLSQLRTPAILLVVFAVVYLGWTYRPVSPAAWSEQDLETLSALWIGSLEPLPADPSNAVADNPEAVILGNRLFFDTRFSANGNVSCATCHQPDLNFTDGMQKGRGMGKSNRNTRSIIGVAYSPWLYWDGRRDSLWSQALSPLEDPNEHGSNRMQVVRLVAGEETYATMYESLFDELPEADELAEFPAHASPAGDEEQVAAWQSMSGPDRQMINDIYTNIGKAIAAYERTLLPEPTRFDAYVEAVLSGDESEQSSLFSKQEILGLQLFLGEARCTECHNGPLLTNHEFHNTGILSFSGELPDRGRINGVREVLEHEFNCLSIYSDDAEHTCTELEFVRTGIELIGAMRTPSLRNLSMTEPYMHKGQIASLRETLDHYNLAPDAMIGHNEVEPLGLSWPQTARLEAFLNTLVPLAH